MTSGQNQPNDVLTGSIEMTTRVAPAVFAPILMAWFCLACTAPEAGEQRPDPGYQLRPSPATDLADSRGQTVYVPVYSHLEMKEGGRRYDMAADVSVRNVDPDAPLTLVSVRYYDNDGKLLGEYLESAAVLPPLGSRHFVVGRTDVQGGVGANFLVEWRSEQDVAEPIVEAVMVGTTGTQGFAFRSPGRVIQEHGVEENGR